MIKKISLNFFFCFIFFVECMMHINSKKFQALCTQAYNIASESTMLFQHSSLLIRNGKVLSAKHNTGNRTRWGKGQSYPGTHAEIATIHSWRHRMPPKVDLLVIRIGNGQFKSSKPCIHCLLNLPFQIHWIYYLDDNGAWQRQRLRDMTSTHLTVYMRCRPELFI
jgi:hypothetical protein